MTETRTITLSTGRRVTLYDVVKGVPEMADTWYFRFVDPQFGPDADPDRLGPELDELCNSVALPEVAQDVARITIALSDREVPFGAAAPQAHQVFEAYSVRQDTCQWEPF